MFEASGGSPIFWEAAKTGPPMNRTMTIGALQLKLIVLISARCKRGITSSNQLDAQGDDSLRSVSLNRSIRLASDNPSRSDQLWPAPSSHCRLHLASY